MWLPKDARKLLKYYSRKVDERHVTYIDLDSDILNKVMQRLDPSAKEITDTSGIEIMKHPACERVNQAHSYLQSKNLIAIDKTKRGAEWSRHDHGTLIYNMKSVSLTMEGIELGRKYNSWFAYSGLWWKEYKSHPIWTFVGFIITTVTAYLLGRLSR